MTLRDEPRTIGARTVALAVLIAAMWGGNIVCTKITLEAFPPIWNAFFRMLFGLPTLLMWARTGGVRLWPERDQWRPLLLLGVLFSVQILLLYFSIQLTSAAYSAVLINASPVLTSLIAHYFVPGDRLSPMRMMGLGVAFLGVFAVLGGKPDPRLAPAPLLGNILSLATAALIAVRMVYTQRLVQNLDSTKTIVWQVTFTLPIFLTAAALTEPHLVIGPATVRVLAAFLYCSWGVVGIAFILWVRLLQKHPPGLISVFVFPTPLFGVLFSALLFGERITPALGLGVAAVAAGVLLVTLEKRSLRPAGK
ncbi:MAG: EamA family transporter [Acidobacteria bacterium]|nr:EamA family transporter [Acidobacteriota bacterium]